MISKIRKLRMTRWNKLTLGGKIAKVIISLLKWAAIIAVVVMVAGVVVSAAFGIFVAFAIVEAIAGGLDNASRAYRPGDCYVRFW